MRLAELVERLADGKGERFRGQLVEIVGWHLLHYLHGDVRHVLETCTDDCSVDEIRERFDRAREGAFLRKRPEGAAGGSPDVPEDLLPIVWFPTSQLGGFVRELARCVSSVVDGPPMGEAEVVGLLVKSWLGRLYRLQHERGAPLSSHELVAKLQQGNVVADGGSIEEVRLPTVAGGRSETTEDKEAQDDRDDTQAGDGE